MDRAVGVERGGGRVRVRGLVLPALLVELLETGRWRHPGDDVLREVMPWFEDPLDFLVDYDEMRRETGALLGLHESHAGLFRLGRGGAPVELPWLDVDAAVLIAVNRHAGDDVAIALDYRTGASDPRVVASDLFTDPGGCAWRTVAPSFSAALKPPGPREYRYVGPAEIFEQALPGRRGQAVASHDDLAVWLPGQTAQDAEEPFTYVVGLDGTLRLAPQRSEHVACAGREPVLGAGEITFAASGGAWTVSEISNQSTGYCPDPSSWTAVAAALDRAGLERPPEFTHPIVFRRCRQCRQRNIVKDDHYVCAVCGGALPAAWNMDEPHAR
ncbi:hypothetical protein ACFQY7_22155 [Actinomadura luteofluorescens]|uniref:Uncharacterized protein n=1 Tax=Actinomadura luteofluorescens TaxID=46163 RepID=A0A7Y9ENM1_9ACTN|nr:hypothetical protein [Actinomadura luteofluorescens]NYD51105.1 hypothetical protein [Actinomadura luteofluorescens]